MQVEAVIFNTFFFFTSDSYSDLMKEAKDTYIFTLLLNNIIAIDHTENPSF